MNFEIDDVMNDTIMGIPRENFSEKVEKEKIAMDFKTAHKRLREAKVDALANSTVIKVGIRELNKALEALEIAEKYEDIDEDIRTIDIEDFREYLISKHSKDKCQ